MQERTIDMSEATESPESLYAEVIIPLALPKNYTWSVPASMRQTIRPGCRVEVNLGKNKKYAGIVKRLYNDKPEFFEPKEILNLLDVEPVVFEQQLQLWKWMANYYMCSEGEVMSAALPSHFKLSSETVLIYNENTEMISPRSIMMNTSLEKPCSLKRS